MSQSGQIVKIPTSHPEREVLVSTITPCFRGLPYLRTFLANVAQQTILDRLEIVLVHNEPTDQELKWVAEFQSCYSGVIFHIVVNPVEPIGVSMNRCFRHGHGKYFAYWSVDDTLPPDALERQSDLLEADPHIDFTYGDFIATPYCGAQHGRFVATLDFDRVEHARGMMTGPFIMMRRELVERAGYFDEQLLQGADFDHLVRLVLNGQGQKTPGIVGYYTEAGLGLSTTSRLQPIECTVIELRYGIYDKIDYTCYGRAREYRIHEVLIEGQWLPVSEFVPNHAEYLRAREHLRLWGRVLHVQRQIQNAFARSRREIFMAYYRTRDYLKRYQSLRRVMRWLRRKQARI